VRLGKKKSENAEGDLTPMIDMTFQLIAFFMIVINFESYEQDKRVQLPVSEIAQPAAPESETKPTVTLQITGPVIDEQPAEIRILVGGQIVKENAPWSEHLEALDDILQTEADVFLNDRGIELDTVDVIVRADQAVPASMVNDVLRESKEAGFTKFVLRAVEKK